MPHKCPNNLMVLRSGELVTGCEACVSHALSQGNSAAERRRWQKAEYRRELTQPVDPRNYIKAYGVEHAREQGFTDEVIRKYS